jgi:hypothetical protein
VPDEGSFLAKAPETHGMRNEIVEELLADLVRESRGEVDVELGSAGRNRGREQKKGRR